MHQHASVKIHWKTIEMEKSQHTYPWAKGCCYFPVPCFCVFPSKFFCSYTSRFLLFWGGHTANDNGIQEKLRFIVV